MNSISVGINYIKAASHVMAKNDIRYWLNGIYIEATDRETFIVATDGHKIIAMRSGVENELTEPKRFVIDSRIVKLIIAASRAEKAKVVVFEESAPGWMAMVGNQKIYFDPVDGIYPDWRRLFTGLKLSGEVANFNPEYLVDMKKAFSDYLGFKINGAPRLSHNGLGMAVVSVDEDENIIGGIMPLRDEHHSTTPPTWAQHKTTGDQL